LQTIITNAFGVASVSKFIRLPLPYNTTFANDVKVYLEFELFFKVIFMNG